jgi:DNA-binding NtrC family response regulator
MNDPTDPHEDPTRPKSQRSLDRLIPPPPPVNLVAVSPAMQSVLDTLRRLRGKEVSVLIIGETGTGKELVARTLHQQSPRHRGPFVSINCGAIPADLFESELFGHERGAFTGAHAQTRGLLEQAHDGSFFLDELNHLPLPFQVKLLRVLQERTFRRVGGTGQIPFDVRLIAASAVDLREAVRLERFLSDLYHRLNVVRLDLPPLRHRLEDIPLLVAQLCQRLATEMNLPPATLSSGLMDVLTAYQWPGNVRELENLLRRLLALSTGPLLDMHLLPEHLVVLPGARGANSPHGFRAQRRRRIEAFERDYLTALLRSHAGDVTRAAQAAGLPRQTLYRLLSRHDLDPAKFRRQPPG